MTDDLAELNTSRRIELVPITKLVGDPKNPKSHALSDIDDSYERFGVVDLITVDGRTGFILSGHGRAMVLKERYAKGEDAPEGITIDPATNEWLIPVAAGWASRNDAEAAAALISMNRLTELGGWADEPLLDLLDEISNSGADFSGVGFTETDLDDLRAIVEGLPDAPDPDDPPAKVAGGGGAKAVTIKLQDPGLIDWWHGIRDTFKSDDEAVASILQDLGETELADAAYASINAREAGKPKRKAKAAKTVTQTVEEPTLDDLDAEVEQASTPVDNPVDSGDDSGVVIDWDNLPDGPDEDE